MARRKRPSLHTRHDAAAQAEEREARITEILDRLRRHHDHAEYLEQRARQCQQVAEGLIRRAAQRQVEGWLSPQRKSR
jgi:hypothetical protein